LSIEITIINYVGAYCITVIHIHLANKHCVSIINMSAVFVFEQVVMLPVSVFVVFHCDSDGGNCTEVWYGSHLKGWQQS